MRNMRMLPLVRPKGAKPVSHDLLLQNTIALVTFQPQRIEEKSDGEYNLQQVYLGVKGGVLEEIGSTTVL